ncbi:DUF4037 domain-containing protein [Geodermatophilus sp. DSM 44513]|uniref:DUF4037 domain-containing protein n=1 Tax=Geodermatophilus sp. DSM 44513 TaxID=1528104 RepID=UPI0028F73D4C|nr:DUF4037 domain-containing protein [Geodermatophilus sp. DSM 44513]WNV74317.1 DUF4037 domain-containing protein [Geodermatophilus sp. DSM 44513]
MCRRRRARIPSGRDLGPATAAQRRTRYPEQVWRWLLACQWHRLAQEEALVARTAEVGDAIGSAVTAARLVRDMMRPALLLQRHHAPYSKWLGTTSTAHAHLDGLADHLARALAATRAEEREH